MFETSRVTLPSGASLALTSAGRGPVALLLHGFPELAVSWTAQLSALSHEFRVVAPDMPGYGGSDAPRGLRAYTLPRLVGQVAELVDLLGGPVHLVGHDWGAAVAWEVAMRHPERVRTLAISNGPTPAMMLREMLTNPRQARMSWYMLPFQVPGLFESLYRRDPEGMMARTFKANAVNRAPFTPEVLAPFVEEARRTGFRGGLAWYRAALLRPALRNRPVLAPTALIWGLRDPALGPWFAEPARYPFVRDLTVHGIDAGHWVPQERPDDVNRILREHWKKA